MNAKAQTGFDCPCTTGMNDYNVDAAGRTLSAIIAATELPATLPTGSCVAIKGLIQINQAYTIDDAEMHMQPGSEIRMTNNVHLTIQNSNIHGCDTMWIGITMGQGRLTFTNNDISDAQWAIRNRCISLPVVPCTNVSRRINITQSRFDRNHIGIYVEPNTGAGVTHMSFSSSSSIHSDTFTCSGNLLPRFDVGLPNYTQTNAYAAIDINKTTSNFNIGSTNASESIVISSDDNNGIRNGIIARNCQGRVNIRNVDISDPVGGVGSGTISLTSPAGMGILLESNSAVYMTDGTTLLSDRGVYALEGTTLDIRNCTFTNDFRAVTVEGINENGIVAIEDNNFMEYEHSGIRVEDSNDIGVLSILRDTFFHSHAVFNTPATTPVSTAIAVIGTDGTDGGGGDKTIANNEIEIDAQDVAISILADARYSIESNNVAYGSGGAGFSNNQGIIHINGNDNYLYNNHIVEDANTKPGNSYSMIAGENNVLCCNTTQRSARGVYFWGACGNSKLRHTGFGAHNRALFCDAGTITGDQPFAANLWPTLIPPGTQDVEHLGGNTEVGGSEFFVPPPTAAPYWPDNVYTPNASVPWFISSSGSNPVCASDEECESSLLFLGGGEEELTENNRFAAANSYEHARYGAMLTWETRRALYAKLKRNPGLLGQEEGIDEFHETASGSAIGDFYAVWAAAGSIGTLTGGEKEAIAAFQADIAEITSMMAEVDAALATTEDTEEIASLESERETLLEALAEAGAGIVEITETEQVRSQALAASLLIQNEALEAEILPAQNEKDLNRVLFEMAAEGTREFNEEQFEVVTAIANQCPLEGGHSVYRARALYELKQPGGFWDSLLCVQNQELQRPHDAAFASQKNQTEVFPNPTLDAFNVRIPRDFAGSIISLRIHTLTGQTVLYQDRESTDMLHRLDVSALPAGIYTLTIRTDDQVIGTHKIVLIK